MSKWVAGLLFRQRRSCNLLWLLAGGLLLLLPFQCRDPEALVVLVESDGVACIVGEEATGGKVAAVGGQRASVLHPEMCRIFLEFN